MEGCLYAGTCRKMSYMELIFMRWVRVEEVRYDTGTGTVVDREHHGIAV